MKGVVVAVVKRTRDGEVSRKDEGQPAGKSVEVFCEVT